MADTSVYIMEHIDFKGTFDKGRNDIRNCHINIGIGKEITIEILAGTDCKGKLTFDNSKLDATMRKLTVPSKLYALG